jgi:endonuclease/exonuclease/phosphatase family metal-dependent hydrolase
MQNTLTILTLFISTITFGQSLNDLSFGESDAFEAVTWNLEFFPKNNQTTIDSSALAISRLDADVFALQEIDDVNAFQQLANSLPNYEGYIIPDNYGNLTLAYLVKENVEVVNHMSIYTSSSYNTMFAGRPPYLIQLIHNGTTYYLINVHFKCCGDGTLNTSDYSDEEYRRLQASNQIKTYIDSYLPDENVIVLGDYNDLLEEGESNNVFQSIIDDSENYLFSDMLIAQQTSSNWSFPSWPSHLDHILISNELIDDFNNSYNNVQTILMDNYFSNGFYGYDNCISDHRPVAIKLFQTPSNVVEENKAPSKLKGIRDIQGRKTFPQSNNLQFYYYENGTVEKHFIIN